jgi:predicted nucleic acid-binding protein
MPEVMMGLRVSGTAGVLLRAKREGRIPAVKALLQRLDTLGFHLDGATRDSILRIAGE